MNLKSRIKKIENIETDSNDKPYKDVTILEINHYSDRLFSFKTSRPQSFRFKNGEFAMIGLPEEMYNGEKQVFRAYSIVSTNYDDHLEFLSIKVPDGPLTSKLQHLQVGDEVLINPKTTPK